MRLVTAAEMRQLDRRCPDEFGIASASLMRRAGLGVAELVRRLARATGVADLPVVLVAGRGNNGGDVFAAAAELQRWGFSTQVRATVARDRVEGDARAFLDALPTDAVDSWSDEAAWDADDPAFLPSGTIFVDGVLGTGATGAPRGAAAGAVRWLRRAAAVGRVVAVDLPSGLEADTGICHEPHVVADATACLALPKTGLWSEDALEACGRVEVVDIGFPGILVGESETDGRGWIGEAELRSLVPARPRQAHKGCHGHVLVVGGAQGYSGAASLAASGALRSGAGLVSVVTPRSVAATVASQVPEAMVQAIGAECTESLHVDAMPADWVATLGRYDAIVAGPGLSRLDGVDGVVDLLLAHCARTLVLDADALNGLAGRAERLRSVGARLVLTPHPGEAGRLLGVSAADVQADRCGALRNLVALTGATVVLKGAGTLVGAPGHGVHRLLAGNPGMATGGTGDVLAGLVGGLLAQGLPPFDAARLAVWWHAAAGDLAAWRGTQASLAATDVSMALGESLRWLVAR